MKQTITMMIVLFHQLCADLRYSLYVRTNPLICQVWCASILIQKVFTWNPMIALVYQHESFWRLTIILMLIPQHCCSTGNQTSWYFWHDCVVQVVRSLAIKLQCVVNIIEHLLHPYSVKLQVRCVHTPMCQHKVTYYKCTSPFCKLW